MDRTRSKGKFTEKESTFVLAKLRRDNRDAETNYDYFSRRDGFAGC